MANIFSTSFVFFDSLNETFDQLSKLKDGWDFGKGNKCSEKALIKAQKFTKQIDSNFYIIDVYPDSDSNVVVELFCSDERMQFTFKEKNNFDFFKTNSEIVLENKEKIPDIEIGKFWKEESKKWNTISDLLFQSGIVGIPIFMSLSSLTREEHPYIWSAASTVFPQRYAII